jgi:hypothetical protein
VRSFWEGAVEILQRTAWKRRLASCQSTYAYVYVYTYTYLWPPWYTAHALGARASKPVYVQAARPCSNADALEGTSRPFDVQAVHLPVVHLSSHPGTTCYSRDGSSFDGIINWSSASGRSVEVRLSFFALLRRFRAGPPPSYHARLCATCKTKCHGNAMRWRPGPHRWCRGHD